jgi:hypothetical protein
VGLPTECAAIALAVLKVTAHRSASDGHASLRIVGLMGVLSALRRIDPSYTWCSGHTLATDHRTILSGERGDSNPDRLNQNPRIDLLCGSANGDVLSGTCDTRLVPTHRQQHRHRAFRLSDAEREQALGSLKAHYADGRLSTEELEVRVEDVYRSDTHGQVMKRFRDLPVRGTRGLLVGYVRRLQRALLRMHLLTFVTINASLVAIWAFSGEGTFWPALLLVPTAVLLAWHVAASRALTRALRRQRW